MSSFVEKSIFLLLSFIIITITTTTTVTNLDQFCMDLCSSSYPHVCAISDFITVLYFIVKLLNTWCWD